MWGKYLESCCSNCQRYSLTCGLCRICQRPFRGRRLYHHFLGGYVLHAGCFSIPLKVQCIRFMGIFWQNGAEKEYDIHIKLPCLWIGSFMCVFTCFLPTFILMKGEGETKGLWSRFLSPLRPTHNQLPCVFLILCDNVCYYLYFCCIIAPLGINKVLLDLT